MAWGPIDWQHHNHKHGPASGDDWVRRTGEGRRIAKYAPGTDVELLERSVVEHTRDEAGNLILTNGRAVFADGFSQVYMVCDRDIGASLGEWTDIVRVEWTDPHGFLHGRPITEDELIEQLQRENPPELDYYREWRAEVERQRRPR